MDKGRIIDEFVRETGVDRELAEDILGGTNWNLGAAVREYQEILNDRPAQQSPASSAVPTRSRQVAGGVDEADRVPPLRPKAKSDDGKKSLHRGFSKAHIEVNPPEANKQQRLDSASVNYRLSFVLPDLSQYSSQFAEFVKSELLDMETMKHLAKYGNLNWWSASGACPSLYALATSGDGNCLLHAASLAMWGLHDRQLILRKALNQVLVDEKSTAVMKKLQRRWKWQQLQQNMELGLVFTEEEWDYEWESVLKLSSIQPRDMSKVTGIYSSSSSCDDDELIYESLEEFHVFVLAHILCRPIFIIADSVLRGVNGEPFAPIPFGGIYLPLERDPKSCCKTPVVLTYDASHFSPLVAMENTKRGMPPIIPITDSEHNLLPVHFAVDPGLSWQFNTDKNKNVEPLSGEKTLKLIQQYMDLNKIASTAKGVMATSVQETLRRPYSQNRSALSTLLKKGSGIKLNDVRDTQIIVGAVLSDSIHPSHHNLIESYIRKARSRFNSYMLAHERMNQEAGPPPYDEFDKDLSPAVSRMEIGPSEQERPPPYREHPESRHYNSYDPRRAPISKADFRAILNEQTGMTHLVPVIPSSYSSSTLPKSGDRARSKESPSQFHREQPPPQNSPHAYNTVSRSPQVRRVPIAVEKAPPPASSPRKERARVREVPIQVEQQLPSRRNSIIMAASVRQCRTQGCDFYGTDKMNYLCTKCYRKALSQGTM